MLEAVVFDFDGVIADSEPLHFQSFRDVLGEERLTIDEAEYYRRYLGLSDATAFREIARQHGRLWSEQEIADRMRRKAARFETLERDAALVFPAADRLVREAASRVPVAVASGARRVEILRILDRADLTRFFTAVVAAEDVVAGKPSPDPYLRALERLSASAARPISPGRSVAIEDSRRGLESARAAGMKTVGVATSRVAGTLEGAADLLIASLAALTVTDLHRLVHD
jgi:beta-phosphoglucomutase